jgi:hypothetical protein
MKPLGAEAMDSPRLPECVHLMLGLGRSPDMALRMALAMLAQESTEGGLGQLMM